MRRGAMRWPPAAWRTTASPGSSTPASSRSARRPTRSSPARRTRWRRLGERFRLGLVTNGIPDVQRTKLEATGLAERFDVVTISGELGCGKPDPRIYAVTLEAIGARPEEAIMVGDNFRRDVTAAQDIGIRAVWIAAGRPSPNPSVTPFLTIDTLAELPALLS